MLWGVNLLLSDLQPRQTALSHLTDAEAYRAADPAGQARRRTARRYPRGDQRCDVHSEHRLPVARAAQGRRSTVHDYLGLGTGTAPGSSPSAARKPRAKPAPRPASAAECEKPARIDSHGFDAGKLQGQEAACSGRYEACCCTAFTAADVQDRDGGLALLATLFGFPFLGKLFADSAYQGPVFHRALAGQRATLPESSSQPLITDDCRHRACPASDDRVKGFVVQPRRWVVERTIAWLNRCRRLAKDWENLNRNALAFIKLASIRLMLRKLCNPT